MSSRLTTAISLLMAAFSWVGLLYLVYSYPPDMVGRLLFLGLLLLAVSFGSAPLLLAVHRRLSQGPEEEQWRQGAVWREAGLLGVFCALCVWLRFIRALNWVNALLLLAVLVLTEILLLARE